MLKEAVHALGNVEVEAFTGLLVEYATRRARGRRGEGPASGETDFEYEIQMAQMNHQLAGVETLFMTTSPQWSFLSSSLVKRSRASEATSPTLVPEHVAARAGREARRMRPRWISPPA